MKIKKFESYNTNFNKFDSDEKVLKITFDNVIYVKLSDIEETDKYKEFVGEGVDPKHARLYGIEEYCYYTGVPEFDWELYDGDGNKIEDEDLYDEEKKFKI